jgi:CBS-domain-containing membrane protein
VQVFATDRNGDEVVIARLGEHDHVGEQSLLPGRTGRRNASLRAFEDVTLLRIPKAEFQQVLSERHTLKDLLSRTGEQQFRQNLGRTSALARRWALFMFVNGFISIGILCGLAMIFQTPFIFPSLGATAFLVFFTPTTPPASPRNTLCAHALAITCGYGALWLTGLQHAGPAIVTELGWARVLAVAVSLGVVSRPSYLVILELAVALLVGQAIVINRLTGVRYPFWMRVPAPKINGAGARH